MSSLRQQIIRENYFMDFLQFKFLIENRIDYLKKNHKDFDIRHDSNAKYTEPHDIIDHFSNADPTPDKKYTQWIIGQYKKKNIRQEDAPRIFDSLKDFHNNKNRLQNKDLNSYKSLPDLEKAVEPHKDVVPLSTRQAKIQLKTQGADLVHSDDTGLTIHHIKTHEAAKFYGANTKWYTARKNVDQWGNEPDFAFNQYNAQGPIHVIQSGNKKYQFHSASNQFMDAEDEPVQNHEYGALLNKHPVLKDHPLLDFWNASHANSDELHKLLEKPNLNHSTLNNIINNQNTNSEHIKKMIKNHSENLDYRAKMNLAPDHPELFDSLVKDENVNAREFAAQHGTHEHRDQLIRDKDQYVRANVAKYSTDEHRDQLIRDKSLAVREQIAAAGNEKHHDVLVKDPETDVKVQVAIHGKNRHREQLMGDDNPSVLRMIVKYGSRKQKDQLMHHESSMVRREVARRGDHEYRDQLVNDPSYKVRREVALHGNDEHHKILMHDPHNEVREAVIDKTENPEILRHFLNDENSYNKNHASRRLRELENNKSQDYEHANLFKVK